MIAARSDCPRSAAAGFARAWPNLPLALGVNAADSVAVVSQRRFGDAAHRLQQRRARFGLIGRDVLK